MSEVEKPKTNTARATTPRLKAGEALGRDGQIVRRKKSYDGDEFQVPDHLKEPGWSYQWNRASVYGQPDNMEMIRMLDNGWTYVDPKRMPELAQGSPKDAQHIERAGLVLMERPEALTIEAREEARRVAEDQLMRQADRADTDMDVRGFTPVRRQVRREIVRVPSEARGGREARGIPMDD